MHHLPEAQVRYRQRLLRRKLTISQCISHLRHLHTVVVFNHQHHLLLQVRVLAPQVLHRHLSGDSSLVKVLEHRLADRVLLLHDRVHSLIQRNHQWVPVCHRLVRHKGLDRVLRVHLHHLLHRYRHLVALRHRLIQAHLRRLAAIAQERFLHPHHSRGLVRVSSHPHLRTNHRSKDSSLRSVAGLSTARQRSQTFST